MATLGVSHHVSNSLVVVGVVGVVLGVVVVGVVGVEVLGVVVGVVRVGVGVVEASSTHAHNHHIMYRKSTWMCRGYNQSNTFVYGLFACVRGCACNNNLTGVVFLWQCGR